MTCDDRYPRLIGHTADDGYAVWEDEPGAYWIESPDGGYVTKRPKLTEDTVEEI